MKIIDTMMRQWSLSNGSAHSFGSLAESESSDGYEASGAAARAVSISTIIFASFPLVPQRLLR